MGELCGLSWGHQGYIPEDPSHIGLGGIDPVQGTGAAVSLSKKTKQEGMQAI